jgi:hypothetical protein
MVTVTGKKGPSKHHGKARGMHIERAENGFTTSTSYDPPENSGSGESDSPSYMPPVQNVHESPEALHAHVAATFPMAAKGKPAAPAAPAAGADDGEADDDAAA